MLIRNKLHDKKKQNRKYGETSSTSAVEHVHSFFCETILPSTG